MTLITLMDENIHRYIDISTDISVFFHIRYIDIFTDISTVSPIYQYFY